AAGKWKSVAQLQAEVLPLYLQRAERGDGGAMFHLSHVYRKGIGVPADFKEGMRWWQRAEQRAIELADVDTMLSLATTYYFSSGDHLPGQIKSDPDKAYAWIKRAHAIGSTRA